MTAAPRKKPARNRDNKTGSDEYGAFMLRMIRMYARKAKEGEVDVTALAQLAEIQRELDERTAEVVMTLRSQGVSWQQIADNLGMTRAAAYKKFVGRPGIEDAEGARKAGGQPGDLR